jgi:ribonuclease D
MYVAVLCCRLWLTAPRPLSPELLSYVVADVRYLPALVLLMERDLLQVRTVLG